MVTSAPPPRSHPFSAPSRVAIKSLWTPAPLNAFQIAVHLIILCNVWRLQNLYPFLTPLQLPTLGSLAGLGLAFATTDPRQKASGLKHPLTWLAVGILALATASISTSLWPGKSLSFITDDFIKTLQLMCLVGLATRNINDTRRFMVTQVVGASLYSSVTITRFQTDSSGRLAELFFYDANDLALVLVCTLPLLLHIGITTRRWQFKVASVLAFGLVMATISRSGSRGGFMALAAILVFFLFRFGGIKASRRIGFVVVLLGVFFASATEANWKQLGSIMKPNDDYNMTAETGRKAVWQRGLGYMMERPLLGVGAACFGTAEGHLSALAKERASRGAGMKWSAAHNSFIQIGAELGIPGLLTFTAILLVAFYTLLRIRRRFTLPIDDHRRVQGLCDALTACLIAFCVAGFFLSQAYGAYIYLTFGIIIGLDKVLGPGARGHGPALPVQRPRRPRLNGLRPPVLRPGAVG